MRRRGISSSETTIEGAGQIVLQIEAIRVPLNLCRDEWVFIRSEPYGGMFCTIDSWGSQLYFSIE